MTEPAAEHPGLVSIGIPTYNRAARLRRALALAVSQTYKNLEIVVSDNGSTDPEVGETIREFAARDPRVKPYRQEKNLGLLPNTEFVLKKASGEYFTWLSDDDWRSPEFIETLVAELERNKGINLAFCDYHEVREDGSPAAGYPPTHLDVFRPFTSPSRLVRTFSYYLQDSLRGKCNLFYSVFRRAALAALDFKRISGDYQHMNTDSLLVFNMLQRGPALIVPREMCTLTCGNTKHYAEDFAGARKSGPGLGQKLAAFWAGHLKDARVFAENSGLPAEKIFIGAVFLPRFLALFAAAAAKKISGTSGLL